MPSTTPLTDAINALTTYANETTGESDTTLSAAFATLIAGYGSGGGGIDADEIAQKSVTGAITLDTATSITQSAFSGYAHITSVTIKAATILYQSAFDACSDLETVDYTPNGSLMDRSNIFHNCSNLVTIILRGSSRINMSYSNCLNGTPFADGGTGGTVYIPQSLYEHLGDGSSSDYKAANGWSTYDGYGTITWAPIEGSQYENYYADGTPIT